MKYLIIDTQNLFHRAIFVTRGDAEQKATLGLHIMISSIAAAWKLFDADHIVFTLEGRSWRKTIYEEYKANRKIAQLQKTPREREDDEVIFSMLNEFISFLENKTNTTVLRCKSTEADDLIARWTQLHPSEHHLIVSSDKDFHQLISPNISQYDGVNKKIYEDKNTEIKIYDSKNILEKEIIEDPEYVLFKKIVRGDPSDNVMSAYPGVREKGTRDKIGIKEAYSDRKNKGFSWNNFMNQKWTDHNKLDRLVKDDFHRNEILINLEMQPDIIISEMDEVIIKTVSKTPVTKVGIHFLKFCNLYGLQKVMDRSVEISKMFSATYNDK